MTSLKDQYKHKVLHKHCAMRSYVAQRQAMASTYSYIIIPLGLD